MKYDIAIEMGSVNTVIYKTKVGVALVEPTLVLTDIDKNNYVAYGEQAKKSMMADNLQLVSPIRNGVIVNKEMAKSLLKYFLDKINEKSFFKGNLVWLVHGSLNDNEKNEFVNLAYSLGYKNVELLPSSVCALEELEIDSDNPYSHMVVNIGGGVTDVAVIFKGKVVQGCTIELGGLDIDNEIKEYFYNNYQIELSDNLIEEVKINLNSILPNDFLKYEINDYKLIVTNSDLRGIYIGLFDKICANIVKLLTVCNGRIQEDINKTGIYVCGGQSAVVGLEKYLRIKLKNKVYVCEDPASTVILGLEKLMNEPNKMTYLIDLNK